MARHRLRRYLLGGSLWALNHSLPLVTGLLLETVFDRVSGLQPAYGTGLALLAALVAAELGRAAVLWSALVCWPGWWQPVGAWIRANLLESVLRAPGPLAGRLPASTGDA
jgi:hypothetical protein